MQGSSIVHAVTSCLLPFLAAAQLPTSVLYPGQCCNIHGQTAVMQGDTCTRKNCTCSCFPHCTIDYVLPLTKYPPVSTKVSIRMAAMVCAVLGTITIVPSNSPYDWATCNHNTSVQCENRSIEVSALMLSHYSICCGKCTFLKQEDRGREPVTACFANEGLIQCNAKMIE